MFRENEKKFVDMLLGHLTKVAEAQDYIKENYGVMSRYDESKDTLYFDMDAEGLSLAAAKDYITEQFDEAMLTVEYGL